MFNKLHYEDHDSYITKIRVPKDLEDAPHIGKENLLHKYLHADHKYLKRFLTSNIGTPYDKVYSNLCRRIKTDFDRYYLKNALNYQVTKGDFVVSENGTLQRRQKFPKVLSLTSFDSHDILYLENGNQLRKIGGIWYGCVCDYADFNGQYDFILKRNTYTEYELISEHGTMGGKPLYCREKKQLNKKELQAYGLKNDRKI